MNPPLKIGLVGLDTSHVEHFTKILNDPKSSHHVPGAQVVVAYPGGSLDFPLSRDRVGGYTVKLRDVYGVKIVENIAEVARASDLILLESVDGRVHLQQFEAIAPFAKPTFIDKPFTTSYSDAEAIATLAKKYRVQVFSSSALRFAEALTSSLERGKGKSPSGVHCYGPLELQPTQPGWFWYGIHLVEMLYTMMGPGCKRLKAIIKEDCELVIAQWKTGELCTIRGNLTNNYDYGALLHYPSETITVEVKKSTKPFYASLVEEIVGGLPSLPNWPNLEETLEIVHFLEMVNESRARGDGEWLELDKRNY